MKVRKPDYILLIHQYAMDNLEKGSTFPETVNYLESNGINTSDPNLINSIGNIFGQVYIDSFRAATGYVNDERARYWVQAEAYYRHLDYIEMQEAYKSSKTATILAIFAIVISAVLAVIQIVVALKN